MTVPFLDPVQPPSVSTVQRDAIPAGRRPPGAIVFNTSTGLHEANFGSDATPVWGPVTGFGAGMILDGAWADETVIPPRTAPTDGRYFDKTVEVNLWNALSKNGTLANPWDTFGGLPAPPAGMFRVPDFRGRGRITKANLGAGNATTPTRAGAAISRAAASTLGALFGEEFHALITPEIPSHSHGGATGTDTPDHVHSGTTGTPSANHTHSGTTSIESVAHAHSGTTGAGSAHSHGVYHGANTGSSGLLQGINADHQEGPNSATTTPESSHTHAFSTSTESANHTHTVTTGIESTSHTHSFTSGGASARHSHSITAEGGGGSHENVHPVGVILTVITL